jgi:hypothetical protein
MAEQWRDIAGHDGVYQVSDQRAGPQYSNQQDSAAVKMKNGRLYVTLSSSGFQRKCTVHSLVASAFLADCPPSHEITHRTTALTIEASTLEYITRPESQKRFVMRTGGYSVNLTKRVLVGDGLRYCPVAESPKGRVKPDIVIVNGKQVGYGPYLYEHCVTRLRIGDAQVDRVQG